MGAGGHGSSLCWQRGAMAQDPDVEMHQLSHPGRILRWRLLLLSGVLLSVLLLHALLLLPVVLLAVLPLMRC